MKLDQTISTSNMTFRPWWLHAGNLLKGHLLFIGDIDDDSVLALSEIVEDVAVYDVNYKKTDCNTANCCCGQCNVLQSTDGVTKYHSKIKFIDKIIERYDVIIVCSKKKHYNGKKLNQNYQNHLVSNGIILIYEPNQYCFEYSNRKMIKVLLNFFTNTRKKEILKHCKGADIKQYCSISKGYSVRHSFLPGLYDSNKNAFLLRQRLKKAIFNSPFYRPFHNSNLWLISNNLIRDDLEGLVNQEMAKTSLGYVSDNMKCAGISYKVGKLILTFSDSRKKSGNIIIVVALNQMAISQRNNEYFSIKTVAKIAALNQYLTSKVQKKIFYGLSCYVMNQTDGITVDMPTKKLSMMTKNAYEITLKIAKHTRVEKFNRIALVGLMKKYADNIVERNPSVAVEMENIVDSMSKLIKQSNFPMVCLHGDLKLENFVLSKQYDVIGIIDWELCELQSFPLLDLYYLIAYNYQTASSLTFNDSFKKIWDSKLDVFESGLIDDYCAKIGISNKERRLLLVVFFIHHYGQRVFLQEQKNKPFEPFYNSVNLILAFISES